jgi:hypothetical protein
LDKAFYQLGKVVLLPLLGKPECNVLVAGGILGVGLELGDFAILESRV